MWDVAQQLISFVQCSSLNQSPFKPNSWLGLTFCSEPKKVKLKVTIMDNLFKLCGFIGIVAFLISHCAAVPKYDASAKSYSNSNGSKNSQWDRAYKENDTYTAPTSDRVERLGYSTGYGSVNSYPHSNVGYGYSPMKIDLGGVVLGAIIGIGALLIVPKVVGSLNGGGYGYSGNYRSVDGGDASGISDMLSKLDEILGKDNIDSANCMQRAVCTFTRQSAYHHKMGTADQTDQIFNTLSENSLVDYMLNGTAIKEALEIGKNLDADPCEKIYSSCPLNKEQSLQILSKLMTGRGGSN